MYPLDPISAIRFGEGELRIDFGGGEADRYRIKDGKLEFFSCRSRKAAWYALSPEEILQHVAHTCSKLALRQIATEPGKRNRQHIRGHARSNYDYGSCLRQGNRRNRRA